MQNYYQFYAFTVYSYNAITGKWLTVINYDDDNRCVVGNEQTIDSIAY